MEKKAKIISACVACAAAVGMGIGVFTLKKNDNQTVPTFSDTTDPLPTTEPPNQGLPDGWSDKYGTAEGLTGISGRSRSMMEKNPDVCGWIRINDLIVDYPIVKDPGYIEPEQKFYGNKEYDPNWFYLNHDLDATDKESGTIFMDYRDVFDADEAEQSENIMLYGHNMNDGSMFGNLRKYRYNYDLYKVCPFIRLSSNYKDYDYVIFAMLVTSGNYDNNDFRYWYMEELDTQEEFDFYVDRCKSQCPIDMGVDVAYGDKLLTLSTCYRDEDNSRFLIVARRLREGENADDLFSVKHSDEWMAANKPTEPSSEEETAAE